MLLLMSFCHICFFVLIILGAVYCDQVCIIMLYCTCFSSNYINVILLAMTWT